MRFEIPYRWNSNTMTAYSYCGTASPLSTKLVFSPYFCIGFPIRSADSCWSVNCPRCVFRALTFRIISIQIPKGFASHIPIHAPVDIYLLYHHWFDLVVCFWMYLFILTRRIWIRICPQCPVVKRILTVLTLSDSKWQQYGVPSSHERWNLCRVA